MAGTLMKDAIAEAALSLRSSIVDFLREIIAIPSFSGQEREVIERIGREMREIGYDDVRIDAMGNLLGRLGSGARTIAIDGHCDTVGIGNPSNWKVDPFKGEYKNGVIFGRGAADQKGGLAAAVFAGKIIKQIGVPVDVGVLQVASVLEEDLEGQNWRHIIECEKISPQAVVLTEPTDLKINIGQRGRIDIKVRTHGRSCHGSTPGLGENAIYKMTPILCDIERLNDALQSDSPLGKGSVTVSDIRSTAPSLAAVADSATIHLDRRLTESETVDGALEQIRSLASVSSAGADVFVPQCEAMAYTGLPCRAAACFPAWLMDRSDLLVQKAAAAFASQFGKPAQIGVWSFSTNGVATRGKYGIPTIGFGPGKEKHAHTPSDQVSADDLVKAAAFYAAFVLGY